MRKFLLSLVFAISAVAVQAQEPAIVMTTQKSIGSTVFVNIAAISNYKTIQFDWGNGTLESYSIGTSIVTVSGVITSNTIKIYGSGIKTLAISSQELTSIDVANATSLTKLSIPTNKISNIALTSNTALTYLECSSNNLSTLNVTANTLLTYLGCNNNNLTSIDISNNTALTNFQCPNNKITTLSLSTNTALQTLVCNKNFLSSLNITSNSALTTIDCSENKLLFNTLPVPQALWTSFTYSPQNILKLPKKEYYENESVDLSSQYSINGNNTTYTWKTKWDEVLIENTDYTVNNGVVTFLKEYSDSVYCEMTNLTFPNLTLKTNAILVTSSVPNVVMTTATTVGSSFDFTIGTMVNNTTIWVDWGNGELTSLTIGPISTVSGTLTGNTIKIYGLNIRYLVLYNKKLASLDVTNSTELSYLDCSINQITTLNVTKNAALTSLDCSSNQLTALDVTKNTALTNLNCSSNQLIALDVTKNTALTYLNCIYNQLSALDVTMCTTLTKLYCSSNNFTLATLPIKQATWTTYQYHSQAKLALTKSEYNINEEIDLSSQLITGGNTTTYKWHSGGFLLVKDVDYTESNGKFTLIKQTGDSIYCEMRNATFPDFSLTTEGISVALSNPILSFTTLTPTNNQLTFSLKTTFSNRKVNVDWGNGVLTEYTVGTNLTNITGTLVGNTIKVYGLGITHLDVTNTRINAIEINSSTLVYVDCKLNNLTFSSLPLKQQNWGIYSYSSQAKISLAKSEFAINEEVDLSSQLTAGANTTNFVWKTISGVTLIKDVDYTENNGKFSFIKQPWDYIYCEMRNTTFPNLTLTTENISVALIEPILSFTTLAPSASQQTFTLKSNSNNSNVKVDWGNGVLADYTVGTSNTNISGTLSGNTVKVYGLGITYADISSKKINAIEIKSSILTYLACKSNNLTFSSLPLKQQNWATYSYSPQAKVDLPQKQYDLTETVNLSSELTVDGKTTNYTWKTKGGVTLIAGTDYNVTNGVTTFLKMQTDSVYCEMTNATFPDLTLTTNAIQVTEPIPNVMMTTTTTIGSEFSFNLCAASNNTPILVDWGNGSLVSYTINTSYSNVTGTLSGNTVKVYGEGITKLYLSNKNLTALDVSGATQLTHLECRSNQLTSLDISKNTALVVLECYLNQLTNLDVSNNLALQELKCSINQLTSLDVSKNTSLKKLFCDSNQITNLNVSQNTALQYLYCDSNLLTSLDVTSNTLLQELLCFSNQLTSIDISKNLALKELWCYSNKLNSLDVSKNTALEFLFCESNQLDNLDLSQNTTLAEVRCHANNLKFSTLPIKETAWTTYIYSPQNVIKLSKKQYGLTETVDLSSELTVNSNNTNYTWKTKGGVTLTAGTDYNVTNGITTFLKVQTDSVYCQMTNATFPDLTLTTSNIKVSEYPLSVGDNELTISVYPNPATDNFTIKMAEEILRVEVYTITGVKVFDNGLYNSTTVTVPLSSMPKGALLIKAYTRNGVYSGKVVKI